MGGVSNWADYWQKQGSDWPFDPRTNDDQTSYMDEENLPVGRLFLFYFDKAHKGSGDNVMLSKFRLWGKYVK
jgi:hypothetical protein